MITSLLSETVPDFGAGNIVAIIVAILIALGFGTKVYGSFKAKGYVDIKSIRKIADALLKDEDLTVILNDVYTCSNVDFSKYNTLEAFLSDQIDHLNNRLYEYIQNNKSIDPLLKSIITRENIVGISDYIVSKLGFGNDLLENVYNDNKANVIVEEEPAIDQETAERVVDTYSDDKNIKQHIQTPVKEETIEAEEPKQVEEAKTEVVEEKENVKEEVVAEEEPKQEEAQPALARAKAAPAKTKTTTRKRSTKTSTKKKTETK